MVSVLLISLCHFVLNWKPISSSKLPIYHRRPASLTDLQPIHLTMALFWCVISQCLAYQAPAQ